MNRILQKPTTARGETKRKSRIAVYDHCIECYDKKLEEKFGKDKDQPLERMPEETKSQSGEREELGELIVGEFDQANGSGEEPIYTLIKLKDLFNSNCDITILEDYVDKLLSQSKKECIEKGMEYERLYAKQVRAEYLDKYELERLDELQGFVHSLVG